MSRPSLHQITPNILASFIFIVLTSATAFGQAASQFDRGTPPQHAAGVSAFGSYTSPDVGTVNLSNGALNISIPLGTVGGRGFSIPITLNYSSKVWSVSKDTDYIDNSTTVAYASYGAGEFLAGFHNRLGPGWTVGIAPWISMRSFGIDPLTSPGCGYNRYLTKLTVVLPDKGEIELRDDYTDGAPHLATTHPNTGNCKWYDQYRGKRWHAADGSGIVFISEVDNAIVNGDFTGVLITADGMRYNFETATAPGFVGMGRATSITDRNGNKITISYPSLNEVDYTDQLNRVTRIKKNLNDPETGQPLNLLLEIPGYGGTTRVYKVKSGVMNQNYRAGINPTLPVITGDNNPQNYIILGLEPAGSQLFPQSHILYRGRVDQASVVNELILPDNRSLLFKYNEFGEVAEVQLPTGGKMQYDYAQATALPSGLSLPAEVKTFSVPMDLSDVDRAVTARRTYTDGTNLEGSWTYTYTSSTAELRAYNASGTLLLNEKHYFMPAGRYLSAYVDSVNGTGYSLWSTGLESRSEMRNAANAVISAMETDWTQRTAVSWWTGYTQQQPANDNRINQKRSYLDNGMMAKVERFYDQYNNVTEVKEYDFDQTLKRRTVTSYLSTNNGYNYQTDGAIHLLSLPVTTSIFIGAATNPIAQTVTEYDVYTGTDHSALAPYDPVTQHDSSYGVSKTTRGNVTRVGQWLNTTNTFIYTYPRFDILGNVVSTKDPNGKETTVSFADNFGLGQDPGTPTQNPTTPTYALPTLITSPPPLTGAAVQTARSQYDYSTGLLTGFRDRNDVVTQTIYSDPFDRPTQVKSALGVTGVETHTSTYYAPATAFGITLARNDSLTTTDLNSIDDASIRSWTVTDGFGRATEVWKRDLQGDVKVVTSYDCLNRVKQTSNPFRPPTESAEYTITTYDLAGRVTSVMTPDNAVVTTSYSGNTVTVTDPASKARKSVTDGLGRLIGVYEDPLAGGLNHDTLYTYDVLDNLVKVTQGSQQRFFMYDSLKRLIRARNPEQGTNDGLNLTDAITGNSAWSIAYQYDSSGDLTQKTDARGVVTNYAYDALHRNITTDFSDTTINPDVKRFYDGATYGKGRFWYFYRGGDISTGTDVDHTAIDSYDAAGRPLVQRQLFKLDNVWRDTYQSTRTYNRAGNVKSQTYPSGNSVTYNYDSAGQLADMDQDNLAFTGNLGGVQRTYSQGISYAPGGELKQEQFGTNTAVYVKQHYNVRRQLCDVRASNVNEEWSGELGALVDYYSSPAVHCGSGSNNNGNVVMSQTIINSVYFEDRYSYDTLNRLTSVNEYLNGSTLSGTQQYNYDRWGNRNITPSSPNALGFNTSFEKEDATNRLYAPNDLALADTSRRIRYDKAGNQTKNTFTGYGTANFDADNRITSIQDKFGGSSTYTYNADGQRTRRKINNQETWQIYGFEGELVAEYAANTAATSPQKEYGYRNGQLLITAEPGVAAAGVNVAAASAGAVATASTLYPGTSASNAINGDHVGTGSWWTDNTSFGYPDWIEVQFAGSKSISEIDVYGLQQNWGSPVEPTLTMISSYALTNFEVQYWTGSAWATVPGGSITGNDKVWRKFTFTPLNTTKIRVNVTSVAGDNHSQVVEIEAYSGTPGSVNWLVSDHLGTPRMLFDQTGTLEHVKRHDYMPFGEELFAGVGSRTVALGYAGGDGIRQQFTQKERDIETDLDYFQVRYYSNNQGRFTSVDPYNPITLGDSNSSRDYYLLQPQNWNRYTYGLNNPQKYVDPDGQNPLLTALGGAVIGGVFGGGFEAAKALYRGESLTDPKVLRRIGAKALNGAVFGAVVGLTGNIAAGSAAAAAATAAVGSVAGGIAERAVDGDDSTEVFSASNIGVDAIAGAAGGFVGNKVTGIVGDMTYALRQGTYETFEQLSGGPFRTMEREALRRALNAYKYTYNPRFVGPDKVAQGVTRGGTRAGITSVGRYLLDIIINQREEQKRQDRPQKPKDCSKGCVTVKVFYL